MGVVEPRTFRASTGEQFIVRSARGPDGPSLAAAWRSIIPTTEMVLTSPGEFTITDEEESALLESWAASPTSLMLGAFLGEEVLGICGMFAPRFRRSAHVVDLGMSVSAPWRDRRVGSALLRAAVEYGVANPWIERITLGVFSHNRAALALYIAHGFQVEGTRHRQARFDDGRYADEIMMARRVKPCRGAVGHGTPGPDTTRLARTKPSEIPLP